jgi:hypothetical protein
LPLSVSGKSVSPVCCPDRLHAVSTCLAILELLGELSVSLHDAARP